MKYFQNNDIDNSMLLDNNDLDIDLSEAFYWTVGRKLYYHLNHKLNIELRRPIYKSMYNSLKS